MSDKLSGMYSSSASLGFFSCEICGAMILQFANGEPPTDKYINRHQEWHDSLPKLKRGRK